VTAKLVLVRYFPAAGCELIEGGWEMFSPLLLCQPLAYLIFTLIQAKGAWQNLQKYNLLKILVPNFIHCVEGYTPFHTAALLASSDVDNMHSVLMPSVDLSKHWTQLLKSNI